MSNQSEHSRTTAGLSAAEIGGRQPGRDGPLPELLRRVDRGEVRADPAQRAAAERLQNLHEALHDYRPAAPAGWLGRLTTRRSREAPKGVYLLGDVGRGKSMLMDLFFAAAPVAARRRVHFHAFMLEVHERLHRARQEGATTVDAIPPLAEAVAGSAWLLCFDELQVEDIADAMLLGRLFEALFARGVVMVTTSNTAPDRLYEQGLQRELFLPFIALIEARLDLVELQGGPDYRLARMPGLRVYHTPLDAAAERALADSFALLTEGAESRPMQLPLPGRTLDVARTAKRVAWFDFDELCAKPLGAADYLAIARHFATVLVSGIPALSQRSRDQALRFVTFIDALYEHRTKLVCSAAESPDRLFPTLERPEFRRTASRLAEMQAADYLGSPHRS